MIEDIDIRRTVSQTAYQAGKAYQREGRVSALKVTGDVVTAQVRGSGWKPYVQSIKLVPKAAGGRLVNGTCSCPVGFNCKHVAAVLLACIEHLRTNPAPAPSVPDGLPEELAAWIGLLDAGPAEDTEEYPKGVRRRLLYVLEANGRAGVTVHAEAVELRKDGTPNPQSLKRHPPHGLLQTTNRPRYLRPSDVAILTLLGVAGSGRGPEFLDTLRRIVATGRGRWQRFDGPALSEGPPRPGAVEWSMDADGAQRPGLALPGGEAVLHLHAPWYVDAATGAMGPVETSMVPHVLRAMLDAPAVPPQLAGQVRDEMQRRLPGQQLPAPQPVAPPAELREKLRPHLRLLAGTLPFDPVMYHAGWGSGQGVHHLPLARLSWGYGPVRLPAERFGQPEQVVRHEDKLFRVTRNLKAEQVAWGRAQQLGLYPVRHRHGLLASLEHALDFFLNEPDPAAWIDFVLQELPELRAAGWVVETDEDFPVRVVEATGDISFEVREEGGPSGSGIDWFDLELGVMVDGERINLAPALLNWMADPADDGEATLLLTLPDGRLLMLDRARLEPIMAPLLELFAGASFEPGGAIRLPRRSLGDLALLEEATANTGIAWSGGEAIRGLGRQLRDGGGIPPCPAPPGLRAELRPYQAQGLAWLQFLRSAGLGGVLADDMGLGKTVQALAHLVVEQQAGRLDRPALVVCPTSLVPNWAAEAARFAPTLRTLVLHGKDRAARFDAIGAHDLVVTTYPLLSRDHATLEAQDWSVVILDEAQTIKNPLAATSKLARTLRAGQRLCLSGTPLENHLGELWSLFDFLLPGLLGDRKQFGARFRGPIEKSGDTARQQVLARRIAPFLLRRTKEQVAADLPPKTEITETVGLGEAQQALYEGIRLAMHTKVQAAVAARGVAGSGIIILDAMLKLRQVCCDPRLLKLSTAKAAKAASSKLERLMELLPQMLEEGRRVLLFSQFTSMLALIEEELDRQRLPFVKLTGQTADRTEPVRRFQSGEVPLFLISLKAGGTGLNLTAADTVIHYDPWWNPAVENQATDRAHRIGQDKPVFVHRMVVEGTIEEKMETLKARKQALAAGILGDGGAGALTLTEDDLETLFAPAA